MDIIINIYVEEKNKDYDLEVSKDLKVRKIIDSLVGNLELEGDNYFLSRDSDDNVLDDMKSLNELEIFDGYKISLKSTKKIEN